MRTLIAYMTRHGCAKKTAGMLKELLAGDTALVDLKRDKKPDLSGYDTVVIGGSIHAGRIQRGLRRFLDKNGEILLEKRLGLYLCCMEEGETAVKQFEKAYPERLRIHAAATGIFGGEFDLDRMNFIERKIVKKAAGIEESVSRIDAGTIRDFAGRISQT
ncbi:MAG TPA: flavodoxin [Candidatus Eisenbacteria bacterium]|uniref:Flavodoxin n=1 Tax=Eiseniibacteriota bacterium TaxID=2212470 RepID=A0A7V2F2Y1_UNCEI|nr:flavodoxin [Candidatus Eisenbacteria bacterium]